MLSSLDHLATRRGWLGASVLAGGALAVGAGALLRSHGTTTAADSFEGGTLVGTVPFQDEGRAPLDTILGDELDGRQFTDLSHVDRDRMETPTARFYLRTRASQLLDLSRPWSIHCGGDRQITMAELIAQAQPQGDHLMECAGNTRAAHFGLLSVASWEGIEVSSLLDRMGFDKSASILISGFDEYATIPKTESVAGASWIFSGRELEAAGAFLAVRMNGQPLTPDHGAPVRLVVPGWYGCACIKWVNRITPVLADAEPTSQMREYAARTHQDGQPARAADYQPAIIDPAAMPVRIEKWLVEGRVKYHVVGIVWGGSHPPDGLQIRFAPDEPYQPVAHLPPASGPWGLWTHPWIPRHSGVFRIRLRLRNPAIRARRLDAGFYVRQVELDRV